jgi:hypothetical protein
LIRRPTNVILEKFDIGTLFEQKELGTVSLNFDVDGKALNGNFLILQIGDISQIEYKIIIILILLSMER